jgi:DNA-binding NarL/FixJ family response regulator
VTQLKPDVLILDLAMPIPTGAEVLVQVKKSAPATKVLLFTAFPDVVEPWIDQADGSLAKTAVSQLPDRLRELTA